VKQHSTSSAEDRRRFLDELLTWREVAIHFVFYHPDNYDGKSVHDGVGSTVATALLTCKHTHTTDYSVLPVWARDSLHEHQGDARSHLYTLQELEEGRCVAGCD
jgi:hypothetical protein